jgi:hypothetical protein
MDGFTITHDLQKIILIRRLLTLDIIVNTCAEDRATAGEQLERCMGAEARAEGNTSALLCPGFGPKRKTHRLRE